MNWRKSSYSNGDGGKCVELADIGESVAIRNSNRPHDGLIVLNRPVLAELVEAIQAGELDELT